MFRLLEISVKWFFFLQEIRNEVFIVANFWKEKNTCKQNWKYFDYFILVLWMKFDRLQSKRRRDKQYDSQLRYSGG